MFPQRVNLPVSSLWILLAVDSGVLFKRCIFRNETQDLSSYIGHHINTLLRLLWAPPGLWSESLLCLNVRKCLACALCCISYFMGFFFTGYPWASVEVAFCRLRMLHRNVWISTVMRVMTSLVVLFLLLGHRSQCSCPIWVLQQEGASLRCWSALWFSVSSSIRGTRVSLLFVWAGTVLHWEGLPNVPG